MATVKDLTFDLVARREGSDINLGALTFEIQAVPGDSPGEILLTTQKD
ncbi:hypothetical protein [Arthrobacter russicus]|uniref:Uncharacterized protein n=1 Tax=Arthrobacter russicus TaxID=172040 RepID=A0ABU1JDU2_9MICC|nr:hypothetical protein [Arthrobacter russicus]MDR6270608.1 hypothetical protein [Arthrobacter russicus]